jgi:hypothetical protein
LPSGKTGQQAVGPILEGKEEGKRFGPFLNKGIPGCSYGSCKVTFGLRICRPLPQKERLHYRLKNDAVYARYYFP